MELVSSLREEGKITVFQNRGPRKISAPKKQEVTGKWRKLHSEELHKLYASVIIIRAIKSVRMTRAWHVAVMGLKRKAYRILVGKPVGKMKSAIFWGITRRRVVIVIGQHIGRILTDQ
jgi:hypothetical protein